VARGNSTYQITTSVGRALHTYDLKRGLNLVFATKPQTPASITATFAWKERVFAAWGDPRRGDEQGLWAFERGNKVDELELPEDLDQPFQQILIFGGWIVGCALTRIEVWKSTTLEHYTTIHLIAAVKGENEVTGGITNLAGEINRIFVGRKDGLVDIWNISTGELVHTMAPKSPEYGSVTCVVPAPSIALIAIAYSNGPLVVKDLETDKTIIELDAGSSDAPVCTISFRTDGRGAGHDGTKESVMATATHRSGDITFWDLNEGGRVAGILRSAHDPPSYDGRMVRGGLSKVEFLDGQPIIVTTGRDNALKTWIFDQTSFSTVPRILHYRGGHSGPVSCLKFLPTDSDGADASDKWLLSGGKDRSLWGWSLRRDGQSTELSQGNIRKKAGKAGILATTALLHAATATLEDLKAPEITSIASSLMRDGGIGALPGKQPIWQKTRDKKKPLDAEISGTTGWESVVTAHKGDNFARTWFWGRKRAGRWAFPTTDGTIVSTVAMSCCGTFALIGSEAGCIDMYNLQSGIYRQRFPSKLTPAQARQLKMQQLKQGQSILDLQAEGNATFPPGTGKHSKAVTGIVVDGICRTLVSCSLDGKVKFWDFVTGTLQAQIDWAPVAITGCRYHGANDLLAFSCNDSSVRIVDMETKKTIRQFLGCSGVINDFCFSDDGRWVIAASQDAIIRIWDLPTSHLIDAIRLAKPCTALAMSDSGMYFAAAIEGELGVTIWSNRTLFRHVATKRISETDITTVALPTTSAEGSKGLFEGAFGVSDAHDEEEEEDEDDGISAPTVDQISADLVTLSLVPRSKWKALLHLDLIKERNKPKEPPKAPEKAPFFLPSLHNATPRTEIGNSANKEETESKSRITKLDRSQSEEAFTSKLHAAASSGNCTHYPLMIKVLT
jgi:U3 small nucleolar RNA-associated protein 21